MTNERWTAAAGGLKRGALGVLALASAFGLGWYSGSDPAGQRGDVLGAPRASQPLATRAARKSERSNHRGELRQCEAVLEGFDRACLPLLAEASEGQNECLVEVKALKGRVGSAATLNFLSGTLSMLEASERATPAGDGQPVNDPGVPGRGLDPRANAQPNAADLSAATQPHVYD